MKSEDKRGKPWLPVKYDKADVVAIKALKAGEADSDQQVRALEYILDVICDRNGMSFHIGPDGARETDFNEGRRFCGNQIVKLANMNMKVFEN